MKQSIRRLLAPVLALIAMAGGVTFVTSAAAQASTYAPDREITNQETPNQRATNQAIVNRRNGECLSTRSWRQAQQLTTRACDGSLFQQWDFIRVSGDGGPDSYYRIANAFNAMCVDVIRAATDNWAHVVQKNCTDDGNQFWKRERTFNGAELLRPMHTNKCLDISWGWAIQYECNGSQNQEFWIN